jgi:hypothetical protein
VSDIYETTAQLAALWPALAAALARDTAGSDITGSTTWTSATLVNADVLAAAITLTTEIPAAHHAACDLLGERWAYRQPGPCLLALPRFASRMDATGRFREASVLASQAAGWLRLTKRALGLRKPDIPLAGYACPYAADRPEEHQETDMLFMAGMDGRLAAGPDGVQVEWVAVERIYCASPDCAASWGARPGATAQSEWLRLGLMLGVPSLAAAS